MYRHRYYTRIDARALQQEGARYVFEVVLTALAYSLLTWGAVALHRIACGL
jgi:hypothetical protein